MKRRAFNQGVLGAVVVTPWLIACGGGGSGASTATSAPVPAPVPVPPPVDPISQLAETSSTHEVRLTLGEYIAATSGATAASPEVNRLVMGSNVQWVDGGDGILTEAGDWNYSALGLAVPKINTPTSAVPNMPVTVLRYPGGLQSDTFHWASATNVHYFGTVPEPVLLDTAKYLTLCEALGADPMITVNIATGTAQEAADWVRAVNITGMRAPDDATRVLRKVTFWEIGNEPYLYEEAHPAHYLKPAPWAAKAKLFIEAMRAVDPTIKIGVPLSAGVRATTPPRPLVAQPNTYPGDVDSTQFGEIVLAALASTPIDFVCLHNGYLPLMPLSSTQTFDPIAAYDGAMLAAPTVEADMAVVNGMLSTYGGVNKSAKIAISEYAPLYIQNYVGTSTSVEDLNAQAEAWRASPAGALYMADLICALAPRGDVLMANHWAFCGNGYFGAIAVPGADPAYARPMHHVLQLLGQALASDPYDSTRVARVIDKALLTRSMTLDADMAMTLKGSTPRLRALATHYAAKADGSEPATVHLVLVHKDRTRTAELGVSLGAWGGKVSAATLQSLSLPALTASGDLPSDRADDLQQTTTSPAVTDTTTSLALSLPPSSLSLLTLQVTV
jgi:alpha-N-arabinofuranosidase